ncbi:MAG TPA: hypothetical protein VJT67_10450 [Longimicrobiaceae bacterium]|nr:hypothetical protein [Longimicrobiaceae bacterium]
MRSSLVRIALSLTVVALPATARVTAQTPQPTVVAAQEYRVNFAVPDAPAFEILGIEPSDLLRPVSVRELTASLSNLGGLTQGLTLPRSFAVEFSPGMLINGPRLNLTDYRNNQILYRLRISGAANRATDSARTQLGFGVRLSLIDKADPRTDDQFIAQITQIDAQITHIIAAAPLPMVSGVVDPVKVLDASGQQQIQQLQQQITALKKAHEERSWNARLLDIAYAVGASAEDSTGRGARVDAHSLWATYANPISRWGQLLVGVRGGMARDSVADGFAGTVSAAARLYAGSNDYKFFAETRIASGGPVADRFLLHGGAEAALPFSLWANASAGWEVPTGGGRGRLVTRFSVKSGLPSTK